MRAYMCTQYLWQLEILVDRSYSREFESRNMYRPYIIIMSNYRTLLIVC